MSTTAHPLTIYRYSSGVWTTLDAGVVNEEAVSLTVNGRVWLSFACTPTDLEALAAGFLFNENLISSAGDILAVYVCGNGSNVDVWLKKDVARPDQWQRTSGCTGGVTTIVKHEALVTPISTDKIPVEMILEGMDQMLASQELYREVRGIHCSVLSDGHQIVYRAEDIGRHNSIDKLSGMYLLAPRPLDHRLVFTTGRISSEMMQKSARLAAEVVVSRTSPTRLSVAAAERLGITLIGYARRSQFLVYSHPERLAGFPSDSGRLPVRLMEDPAILPA